ncbi:site-specific integrase [Xanthomonas campestris]|uniref:site-specific integrase n=1 Tax=Xanthomonas campestris TaxID=339 RepID=UPI000E1FA10D|nr:site-specific integrase [Xanthomonas campestris]
MRIKLSPRAVAEAKPASTPYEILDSDLKGLLLRVQPSGVKSFIVTWARGKRRTLGRHPVMTVAAARHAALAALTEASQHGAPLAVIDAQKPASARPQTLREFAEGDYRRWVRRELKRGDEAVSRILRVFGLALDTPLPQIDRRTVEDIITARRHEGASVATTNRDLAAIKGILTKALEWSLIPAHPLERLKASREIGSSIVRYLSQEEDARLRAALENRERQRRAQRESGNTWCTERGGEGRPAWPAGGYTDHLMPMVLVALNTGLRRGELFGLTWSHTNLATKVLTVAAGNAKSGRTRHVPLNSEALQVLSNWRLQSNGTGLVFPNPAGRRFDNIQTSWERLATAADLIAFRFHDLRHSFASKLVMRGVDLNTVRELLGHSDIKMTLRYAHLAPDKLAEAVSRL